jgi:hypothetical protein
MRAPLDTGVRIAIGALGWLLGVGLQVQQLTLWPATHYLALLGGALAALAAGRWLPGAARAHKTAAWSA